MKKTYIIPNEKIADLGLEGQLLQGIVSGNGPTGGGLDTTPTDPEDGEEMSVKAQYNLWNNEW